MKQHPSRSSAPKSSRNDEALARADVALRMGQAQEAERLAGAVLRADKGNLLAATLCARALMALGRNDDAIAILERATRRGSDPAIATLLAVALAAAGRRDDALAQLEQVTSGGAAFPPAFREHIGQLSLRGRIDDAIAVAKRGMALSPESIELRLDLASLYSRRNDRASARTVLTEAAGIAPGRPDVLAELATIMLLDGDYAAAADTYRRSLALQPDNAMTRSNLAACQFELDQRDAGEATLRVAVNGRPQMIGRAIHALAASSHGRFFLRPSAVTKFLSGNRV